MKLNDGWKREMQQLTIKEKLKGTYGLIINEMT